jgi:hypothetical protein
MHMNAVSCTLCAVASALVVVRVAIPVLDLDRVCSVFMHVDVMHATDYDVNLLISE